MNNSTDTKQTPGQQTPAIKDPSRESATTVQTDRAAANSSAAKREPQDAPEAGKSQR